MATQRMMMRLSKSAPPRLGPGGAVTSAVVIFIASAAALIGLGTLATLVGSHSDSDHSGHEVPISAAGGVEVSAFDWQWMSHDMFGGPPPKENHFPMPAQMMPGMQSSDVNRLHVEVTATNRTDAATLLSSDDFQLWSTDRKPWNVNDASSTVLRIPSHMSISVDLYFDIPLAESVAQLVFTKDGEQVAIPFGGTAPDHEHSY